MKLKKAINIGKACGLNTINECFLNIEIHAINFFAYTNVDNELVELSLDITKIAKDYNITDEEVLNWSITEYELYAK